MYQFEWMKTSVHEFPWLLPPFLLPRALGAVVIREASKSPDQMDWSTLIAIDIDIFDSINAELAYVGGSTVSERARALDNMPPGRRAWIATKQADISLCDGGVVALYAMCADGRKAQIAVDGYRLFGEDKLAERLDAIRRLHLEFGVDGARAPDVRNRLLATSVGLANPYGDGSLGRIRYAATHINEFCLP
jgi:hypothetical protein